MAKRGDAFIIHGAFKSKSAAKRKERSVPHSFVVTRKVKKQIRHVVLEPLHKKRG